MVPDSVIAKFWKNFDQAENGCWIWRGAKTDKGYGRLRDRVGRQYLAHRVSWYLHSGSLPPALFVCHKCDVRDCVNPNHLFLGTQLDNMRDAAEKGRFNGRPSSNAKLNQEKADEIRRLCRIRVKHREIAERFGVSKRTVDKISRGETWAVA